jgi:FeS assembly SUF system protein
VAKPINAVNRLVIEGDVVETLRTIYDPEIPVSIYDMGLIYGVEVGDDGAVRIEMTLTAPGCPVAVSLPIEVRDKVQKVPGVSCALVEIVWDPPWTPERMSEEARLELGWL